MNQKTKGQVDEEFIFYLIYLKPRQLVNLLTCSLKKPCQLVNSLTCPFNKPCQLKYTSSPNNLLIFQYLIHIFAPVGINLQVEQTIYDAGRIKRPGITRDTVAV